jgi:hypothetical protein
MGIKADYISKLRAVPDGIADFLTTTFPVAPSISTPTTVDEAGVAVGVLSKFLLDAFRPFAGITIVELLLRIGQHSNVSEAMLLSVQEYIASSDAELSFEILEPVEGQGYYPGDMRFRAQAINGTLKSVHVEIGDLHQTPPSIFAVDLAESNGVFGGYLTMAVGEYGGEYGATFTGTFTDDAETSQMQVVNFVIAEVSTPEEPLEEPGGVDANSLQVVEDGLAKAFGDLVSCLMQTPVPEAILDYWSVFQSAYSLLKETAAAIQGTLSDEAAQTFIMAEQAMNQVAAEIADVSSETAETVSGLLGDVYGYVSNVVTSLWDSF